LVPSTIFETEEGKKKLQHLVLGITEGMLREGIELTSSTNVKAGIKVRLTGKDIELDLSDEAFSDLLLKYLLPRYREIVSGQA
jgi:V/A-type H+-transporting ATPase subunit E